MVLLSLHELQSNIVSHIHVHSPLKYSKIVLTGPESTGKSTTAALVSNKYDLPLVSEYAREYLDIMATRYEREDLDNIAKVQLYRENLLRQSNPRILCDTDILTLFIWSKYKYGKASFQLRSMYEDNDWSSKLYLLFAADIPWSEDAQRENPEQRQELFDIYKNSLDSVGAHYHVIKGQGDDRVTAVTDIIDSL